MTKRLILLAAVAGLAWVHPTVGLAAEPDQARSGAPDDFETGVRLRAEERALAASPPPSIQDVIAAAFAPLGPPVVGWAEQIAWCESKFDPMAVNPESSAAGLFQFLPSTWRGTPQALASPFDPVANAQAAAWLYTTYGPSQWECRA